MLVSCVCPTTGRRDDWLPRSIGYFLSQSYPERELVIVVDPGYIPRVPADPRIRVVTVPALVTLGAKRNFACNVAKGELIAHWDDDDYSAPGRLEDQVSRLLRSGRAVTGYTRMNFTDGDKWWQYKGDDTWPLGTSLLFKKDWWRHHPFPDKQVASDNTFITTARAACQIACVDAGAMMYATIHRGNTSARKVVSVSTYRQLEASEVPCFA